MKYHIVTFGCQMNVHESEKIAGMLEDLGYTSTDKLEESDIIVFNTCAIREGAQDRAFGNIGNLKKLKKQNKDLIIAVGGCMTQQKNIAEKLFNTFPFIDIVYGTKDLHLLSDYIKTRLDNKKRLLNNFNQDLVIENMPIYRTSGDNAWVNIIYGCNNFCSYCIVPYVRGRERSRKKENILQEVRDLVKKGYKTITLLGQNVNSYGNDDKSQGNFSNLLQEICNIPGDFKLTFMTSHPKDLTDETINTIARNDKILKEIHLPCQSGSNKILKAMNRKYTRESYIAIIDKIKQQIPKVRLTSDFIVGFPGETEQDFQDTLSLVEYVKYDAIFAFMYSVRPGTAAEKFENQIPENIKNERVNKLLALEKQIQKNNKE